MRCPFRFLILRFVTGRRFALVAAFWGVGAVLAAVRIPSRLCNQTDADSDGDTGAAKRKLNPLLSFNPRSLEFSEAAIQKRKEDHTRPRGLVFQTDRFIFQHACHQASKQRIRMPGQFPVPQLARLIAAGYNGCYRVKQKEFAPVAAVPM